MKKRLCAALLSVIGAVGCAMPQRPYDSEGRIEQDDGIGLNRLYWVDREPVRRYDVDAHFQPTGETQFIPLRIWTHEF